MRGTELALAVRTMRLTTPHTSPLLSAGSPDLICLSHLRWNFVFQRPQHLMTRYAKNRRVYFVEEPIHEDITEPRLTIERLDRVWVVVPRIPTHYTADQSVRAQRDLLDQLIRTQGIKRFVLWYYTPLALKFADHLAPIATVYDCMDELSAFKNAPLELGPLEQSLMRRADVVFTGGHSLYEAKKAQHANIHAMASSVDVAHFSAARTITDDPVDQRDLPAPAWVSLACSTSGLTFRSSPASPKRVRSGSSL